MTRRSGLTSYGHLPPLIVMGGVAGNALSIARSLGRQGVDVYLLGAPRPVAVTRYARDIRPSHFNERPETWIHYLLGRESDHHRGAVLLACSDQGIEILIEHREELAEKYILDISDPQAQRCLLSKLSTYQQAREAGVPTPLFWTAESIELVQAHKYKYVYPLLIKPLYSHKFQAAFGGAKFFRARDYDELINAYRLAREHDLQVILLEEIPGPDDRLCSYYTYLDEGGEPQFDFTKRIIRRFPESSGLACYHATDCNPEARALGLRLLEYVGLRGLGNVEFKRDDRDGALKLIECNARFTAGNVLLVRSGYDLGEFVYHRLVRNSCPSLRTKKYQQGLHLWYPREDFRAFLALRAQRRLSLCSWLASLAHRQVLPYFSFDDPLPSLVASLHFAKRAAELGEERLRRRCSSLVRRAGRTL